jgi:hypothetical protein
MKLAEIVVTDIPLEEVQKFAFTTKGVEFLFDQKPQHPIPTLNPDNCSLDPLHRADSKCVRHHEALSIISRQPPRTPADKDAASRS